MNNEDSAVQRLREQIAGLERRLEQAEEDRRLLETLMDHLPGGVTLLDANGTIKYVSHAGAAIGGKRRADLEGKSIAEAFGGWESYFPDGETRLHLEDAPFLESLQTGQAVENFEAIVKNEGETHLLINFIPLATGDGQAGGAVVTWWDVTHQNEAQEAQRSLARFPGENPFPVLRVSNEGAILYANKSSRELLQSWSKDKNGNAPAPIRAIIDRCLATQTVQRAEQIIGDKTLTLTFAPIPENNYVNIYGMDITEQKRIDQALQDSENQLSDFLESTHDSFFALDGEWRIVYANRRYAGLIGANAADLIGKNFWESLPKYLGTSTETYLRQAMAERIALHYTAGGLYTGSVYEISVFPTRDGLGVFASDRTEQYKAEEALRQSENALREYSVKLETSNHDLQQFAFIASHDLQEPLRKITNFAAGLLARGDNLNERQRDYLERMQAASKRMQRMIADLLALSRVSTQDQPFEAVDLSQITADVISDLELQIRQSGGAVELSALPLIHGNPLQMRQLMQNLLGNALKYHKKDAAPQVRISSRVVSPDSVQILVEDDGIGFDDKCVDQIFLPFQRLVSRSEYEGTGMGLAICKKITDRHRGEITAHAQSGAGATFIVTLPAFRSAPGSTPPAPG